MRVGNGIGQWLVVLVAACSSTPGRDTGRTSTDAPRTFVEGFYAWYVPAALAEHRSPVWYRAMGERKATFSPTLLTALQSDSATQSRSPNEIDGLDFDPFLNGQDLCEKYELGAVTQQADKYLVEVYGVCAGQKHSTPDVFAQVTQAPDSSWMFVNFLYSTKEGDDLLSVLSRLHSNH